MHLNCSMESRGEPNDVIMSPVSCRRRVSRVGPYLSHEGVRHGERAGDPAERVDDMCGYSGIDGRRRRSKSVRGGWGTRPRNQVRTQVLSCPSSSSSSAPPPPVYVTTIIVSIAPNNNNNSSNRSSRRDSTPLLCST